ncbi:MAG: hypothetical protein KDC98_01725 [Planctomycetes bacterium]|nr:hypothetical protein [Planctomycetota bacterium]
MDQDFDSYRRQRIRSKSRVPLTADASYENSALRELEQAEEREVRDQQLTREVHEFFASATKQAATIVERMAHDAVQEADVRIEREMESFLIDSFARMNSLVLAMLHKKRGMGGEEKLEPNVNNIVGPALDEFRYEGTAELLDKHIGQDPFATDLDDVRRELLDSVGEASERPEAQVASISEHLVAAIDDEDDAGDGEGELEIENDADQHAADEAAIDGEDVDRAGTSTAISESEPETDPNAEARLELELERFKGALRSLVRQGTMSKDEARAAWVTRLRSLGLQ